MQTVERGKYPPARPLSDTVRTQARWPCSGYSIPRPHHQAEALRGLPHLRVTLDKLLTRRLPDVELLTTSGAGVPMLVASYATERTQVASSTMDSVKRLDILTLQSVEQRKRNPLLWWFYFSWSGRRGKEKLCCGVVFA